MAQNVELIARLQSVISENAELYPGPAPYAIIDFPNHPNVGDSAIWLGEILHLKSTYGYPPTYVADMYNFNARALEKAVPEGPVFLHGGGNFGDIWIGTQKFRESVIKSLPHRQLIQLPQTVHFNSVARRDEAARIVNAHRDFLLFVRDETSLKTVRNYFDCPVRLAPDMAFCVGALPRPVPATHKLLLLLRTDKENARDKSPVPVPEGTITADWLDEERFLEQKLYLRTMEFGSSKGTTQPAFKRSHRERLFESLAENRVDRGLKLLSSAEYVITDRLHAHILCVLLGIPHTVLDNNYGKISSFIELWTKDCSFMRLAPSLEAALGEL